VSRPATSRLKVNPPLGVPPSLEFRTLAELHVDETYQRSLETDPSRRLIRQIAQFWDWGLCQPLAVARRGDGSLMVVDGQHRLEAARTRSDIAHLPCVITAYRNAGDEAAAFVALNQNRKPLQPLDIFKAALAAGDDTATAVQAILTRAGLRLAPHTNWQFWKPGMLANVNAMQTVYRKHGEATLFVTLSAIAKGFADAPLRYAGTIFSGLIQLTLQRLNLRDAPVDLARDLGLMLASRTQDEWMRLIRADYGSGTVKFKDAAANVFTAHFRNSAVLPSSSPPSTDMLPAERAWCGQCDQMVSGAKAAACASPFCKLKAKAA
jgi:hypothetical protein